MEKQELAQTNSKKKGGRYSLENTKERRDQVFKLHFDDDKSNREIAKMMNVNPKTINADIHEILKGISRTFSQNSYPQLILEQLLRFKQKRKEMIHQLSRVCTFIIILFEVTWELMEKLQVKKQELKLRD